MDADLLYPLAATELKRYKAKRLVPTPNSHFVSLQCKCGCITNTFDHAKSVVNCTNCKHVLLVPRAGKAKKTEEVSKSKILE